MTRIQSKINCKTVNAITGVMAKEMFLKSNDTWNLRELGRVLQSNPEYIKIHIQKFEEKEMGKIWACEKYGRIYKSPLILERQKKLQIEELKSA